MTNGHREESSEPNRPANYNKDEVDAFLDLTEQELARLAEENIDLKTIVADQAAVIVKLHAELGM